MFLPRKLTCAGLALGLLTMFGAVAQAQQPSTQNPDAAPRQIRRGEGRGNRRGPGPGGNFHPRLLQQLNLTDDQKKQIRTVIEQSFAGTKGTREELRQLGEKRRQGTLSAEDQARAKTLHQQIRASMADTETKIAAVLTADQKAKAAQLAKERKEEFGRSGGRRRRDPGQPGQGSVPAQKPSSPPANQ
jgi:Spy/CpxP family protein refolding chaperone